MIHITQLLSDFTCYLSFNDLDSATIDQTKLYIADYISAVYAGYKINVPFNNAILEIIEGTGDKPEASVLITGKKLCAENAAYMNAVYAHGADMDDGNRKARGHIAAHVMSAVFSLAQTLDVSWKNVITAINAGYEVYNRIAAAVQPDLVHRGFHSTGTAGAIACGAACAKLLNLDSNGIYSAMGISAIQASGLIIIAESGQACKPLNPANAARTGIISAKLAQKGIRGPLFPLESSKGWFHAMGDNINEGAVTDGLGTRFTINDSYLKPYPSCRHTHCGIEAAINIRNQFPDYGYTISDIEKINVYIYNDAIQIAGQIKKPSNTEEAKFSIHYGIASALFKGSFSLQDITEPISEPVSELTDIIELIPDASMENTAAGIRGARVSVVMHDGKIITETVLLPKGDSSNPLSWDDMRVKMADCMKGFVSTKNVDTILDRIHNINFNEKYESLNKLLIV